MFSRRMVSHRTLQWLSTTGLIDISTDDGWVVLVPMSGLLGVLISHPLTPSFGVMQKKKFTIATPQVLDQLKNSISIVNSHIPRELILKKRESDNERLVKLRREWWYAFNLKFKG